MLVGVGHLLAWIVLFQLGAGLAFYAVAHVTAMALLALLLVKAVRSGQDVAPPMLALIAGAVAGPVGPLGAAYLAMGSARPAAPSGLIAAWYERIALSTAVDPDVRLCDDVGVGRTLNLGLTPPPAFPSVMATGTLGQRQVILGHIARHFHPAYLGTLKLALESPEPTLRVQAAAVAAHINPDVRRSLAACAAKLDTAIGHPEAALDLLGQLDDLIASGLLDEAERLAAIRHVRRLGDAMLGALSQGWNHMSRGAKVETRAQREATLERLLIARRRFGDLRSLRAVRAIAERHPTARFRRLATSSRLREAAT